MYSLSVRFEGHLGRKFRDTGVSDRIHLERHFVSIPAPVSARRREASPTRAPLSTSTWRRLRATLTAGLFVVATLGGVGVGLQGAAVSPVAPAVAPTAAAPAAAAVAPVPAPVAPAGDGGPGAGHGHGRHR